MRRGAVLFAAAIAGCAAFGTDPGGTKDTSTNDGGVTSDASAADSSATDAPADGAVISKCPAAIADDFNRSALIQAPWIGVKSESPSMVHILDQQLTIETTQTPRQPYVLQTAPFVPPTSLACSFTFKKSTEFNSSNHVSPIDLFVYVLHYGDGSHTELRFSYFEGAFTVRQDQFSPLGDCAADQCPLAGSSPVLSSMTKDKAYSLTVAVDLGPESGASIGLTGQTPAAIHPQVGNPTSAEVWFGIWSYSDFEQAAQLDDLSCNLNCGP